MITGERQLKEIITVKRKIRPVYIFVFIIIAFVIFLLVFDFYECPLLFLFGIPCPFCGMSRAFFSLLKGDFAQSFYYHPLWPLVVITAGYLALRILKLVKLSAKALNVVAHIFAMAFLICYVVRHVTGSAIVEPVYEQSLIYKIFSRL